MVGLREREERQRQRMIETELELEDAVNPRGMGKVFTSSKAEYEDHCRTHLPYRSWCPVCVKAKKKSGGHHKSGAMSRGVPVISIDYMFMNEKNDPDNRPILVVHDSESQGTWAIAADNKGESEYVVKRVTDIINILVIRS